MHSIIQLLLITLIYNAYQSSLSSSSFIRSNVFLDPILDMHYIQIYFSRHKHKSMAYLDFTNKYSTIKENRRFNTEQPTTIEHITDTDAYYDNNINTNKYSLCRDEVYIEDKQLKSFPFLLEIAIDGQNYDDFPIHSTVSLSRSKTSLLNLLYDSGMISKRIMRFHSFNIELGEISNDSDRNDNKYTSYLYIPLLNNTNDSNLWSTDLIGVITGVMPNLTNTHERIAIDINNYTHYDHCYPITFNANEIGIVFPEAYIDFFYFNFFELFISLHKCFLKKRDNAKVFECDKSTIGYFDDLFIFFDGIMIKFKTKELFYSINERSVVSKISFKEELKTVVMGMEYMLTKAIVFNEEEKVIGFKSSEDVYAVKTNFNYTSTFNRVDGDYDDNDRMNSLVTKSYFIILTLLYLICFLLLPGIVLLVLLKKIQLK